MVEPADRVVVVLRRAGDGDRAVFEVDVPIFREFVDEAGHRCGDSCAATAPRGLHARRRRDSSPRTCRVAAAAAVKRTWWVAARRSRGEIGRARARLQAL